MPNSKFDFNVSVGPISKEVVEAVFQYSQDTQRPVSLISSKNQIDYDSGYVEGWSTYRYMEFVNALKVIYPKAKVAICRDHCGPGFMGGHFLREDIEFEDACETARVDAKLGFDLIHVDLCHMSGTFYDKLKKSCEMMTTAQAVNPDIVFEFGSDDISDLSVSLTDLERRLEWVSKVAKSEGFPILFYVVNTGSRIMEGRQVGSFNKEYVRKAHQLVHAHGFRLKEHNADYQSKMQIGLRLGVVDAINVAPEFGTVQSQLIVDLCSQYGVDLSDWLKEIHNGNNWRKWMEDGSKTPSTKYMVATAGHYHFSSPAMATIRDRLNTINPEINKQFFIDALKAKIAHYDDVLQLT